MLKNFKNGADKLRVCVVGASGGIGKAFVRQLNAIEDVGRIYCLSRTPIEPLSEKTVSIPVDLLDENSIEAAADLIGREGPIDILIIATGILHDGKVSPEKDWRQIEQTSMEKVFAVNTIGPAILMAKFAELLPRNGRSIIAALSARVGSISDNRLGGWYSYRASKSALNQIIRTFSIELKRKRKEAIVIGLHPGTVATQLSEPFQNNMYERFSPEQSANYLLQVIADAKPEDSGNLLDWQGKTIPE